LELNNDILLQQIAKAKKGNQSAFNFLLDTYWKEVYGFQLKRTQNEIDAEDITIQTFSKAFHKIDLFNEEYKFSTWLITISKNIHHDILRKKKTSITLNNLNKDHNVLPDIIDDAPSAEDKIIIEQNLAKLLRDIKKLKPHYQEVIQLRYFQEMSYKEIAKEINEPMTNVKVKLLRARKLLAEIIQQKK
jgi:RNA polymerase sigma-70 factor (ECF subfamily)